MWIYVFTQQLALLSLTREVCWYWLFLRGCCEQSPALTHTYMYLHTQIVTHRHVHRRIVVIIISQLPPSLNQYKKKIKITANISLPTHPRVYRHIFSPQLMCIILRTFWRSKVYWLSFLLHLVHAPLFPQPDSMLFLKKKKWWHKSLWAVFNLVVAFLNILFS